MANNWGLIQSEDGGVGCWHVVPLVNIDGQDVCSAAHEVSPTCQCKPFRGEGKGGWTIWQHFDPTHDGAMTDEEWTRDIMSRRLEMVEANYNRPVQ